MLAGNRNYRDTPEYRITFTLDPTGNEYTADLTFWDVDLIDVPATVTFSDLSEKAQKYVMSRLARLNRKSSDEIHVSTVSRKVSMR